MNIQNISYLSDKLQSLGFEASIGYRLLQNFCFKPASFSLHQKVIKGNDVITFQFVFERSGNDYTCLFYDAVLRKEIKIADVFINDISTLSLDKRMTEINWTSVFMPRENKDWNAADKTLWEQEEKVESIISDLSSIESATGGKEISCQLKTKHWSDTLVEKLDNTFRAVRNKFEITQRFYFFENQAGISLEEAYRFLNNRWLEKSMQKKKIVNIASPVSADKISNVKLPKKNGIGKKKRRT